MKKYDDKKIIRDVYEANANLLISELLDKSYKLKSLSDGLNTNGDYNHTILANIHLVEIALEAIQDEYLNVYDAFP